MAEQAKPLDVTPELLQAHPELILVVLIIYAVLTFVLVGGAGMWIWTIRRWYQGKQLLTLESWTPRVWGMCDLLITLVLIVFGQTISLHWWSRASGVDLKQLRGEGDLPLTAMSSISASYLVVMGICLMWLGIRYGTQLSHAGFSWSKFKSHMRLGVGAALLSLPIVYGIMALVSAGLNQEYDHPLLERMSEDGSWNAFFMAAFCAVVAAPICEEFLFRVLLQGWLQSLPWSSQSLWWLLGASTSHCTQLTQSQLPQTANVDTQPSTDDAIVSESSLAPIAAVASSVTEPQAEPSDVPPIVAPMTGSLPGDTDQVLLTVPATGGSSLPSLTPPLWPVFVSGTLFGLAHWGYGLSFVPLIVLGIILGMLYRATHSIWPSLTVHFILNFLSILGLGLASYLKSLQQ